MSLLTVLESEPSLWASLSDKVDLGWLALYLPITGVLVLMIKRGLGAEHHAVQSLGSDISTVRETFLTQLITPTLAGIAVTIRDYMKDFQDSDYLPGEPGDPRVEAERILGFRATTFSNSLADLQRHYAKVTRAAGFHDRKVSECKRSAWASLVLLLAWTYWMCAVAIKDNSLPGWSVWCAIGAACLATGWAAAEWWAGNHETNALSELVREANEVPQGGTN